MKCKIYLLLLSLWSFNSLSHEDKHQHYHFVNYQNDDTLAIKLSPDEEETLQRYKVLDVGISAPDYPPFDMTVTGDQSFYKGISADYLDIIAKKLNVKINVKHYKSRDMVINAALNGNVDLITTANEYEKIHGLELTVPYVFDRPSVFRNAKLVDSSNIKLMSIVNEYLPDAAVHNIFPNRKLIKYASREAAVAAAALGEVDAVIVDLVSANYLINNSFSGKLKLDSHIPLNSLGNSFATSKQNEDLINIFNKAINNISLDKKKLIRKRWSGGGSTIPFQSELPEFTKDEITWINNNKVIVAINKYTAPLTYIDDAQSIEGYGIEVLDLIKMYSGLNFEYIVNANFSEQLSSIVSHKASMVLLPLSEIPIKDVSFTKEFSSSSYVYVTPKNVQGYNAKTIIIPDGILNEVIVKKIAPNLNVVITDNYLEVFNSIAQDPTKITIAPLALANYYVNNYFSDVLKVNGIVDDIPKASVAFAINSSNKLLKSILNKTLTVIPPDELQIAENRWHRNALPARQSWKDYKYTIITIIVSSTIMILISIVWAFYTHNHYRKRLVAKKELNQQLQFMQSIVDAIPHPIYVRNKLRELTMCNESYQKTFKASREELLNKSTAEGIDRSIEALDIDDEYIQALNDGISVFKDRELHIDGEKFYIYHWFKPYGDEDGNIEGLIGGWIDISDRVRLVEELRYAKEVADSSSQAKSTFLATMSHEIRTPMNAIIGMLELVLKRPSSHQFDYNSIKVAYDSANGLLELIGDILDIARIEAGQLSLSPIRTNLKVILSSIIRVFDGLARQKGLAIQFDFDPKIKKDVLVDPVRIKQIMSNLISNAIKFTDTGYVHVRVRSQCFIDGKHRILFTVTDTGIGISKEEQLKLFTPFSQVHGSHNTYGGTGLGLMISKSLCEMMEGELYLESDLGQGTMISMALTLSEIEDDPSENRTDVVPDITTIAPLEILIVDDHPANRLLLAQQLNYLGHIVEEAENGLVALKMFKDKDYDIVITDCNMPEMDGYILCRRIRDIEKEQLQSSIVIGYTANAQKEAMEACIDAGMNDCLFKPISLAELDRMLKKFSPEQEFLNSGSFYAKTVEKLTGNNKELVIELLKELLKSNKSDLSLMYKEIESGNINSVKNLAHKIKGAAKIIDARKLVWYCEQLEVNNVQDIMDNLKEISVEIKLLEKEILNYINNR